MTAEELLLQNYNSVEPILRKTENASLIPKQGLSPYRPPIGFWASNLMRK